MGMILPSATPTQEGEPRDPWAHVDGCPECVANTEAPWWVAATTAGHLCAYLCSDCGHSWTTSWGL